MGRGMDMGMGMGMDTGTDMDMDMGMDMGMGMGMGHAPRVGHRSVMKMVGAVHCLHVLDQVAQVQE